jgi:hypothetical protein
MRLAVFALALCACSQKIYSPQDHVKLWFSDDTAELAEQFERGARIWNCLGAHVSTQGGDHIVPVVASPVQFTDRAAQYKPVRGVIEIDMSQLPGFDNNLLTMLAAHEIGHVLGMEHTLGDDVMNPHLPTYRETPSDDDVRQWIALWGVSDGMLNCATWQDNAVNSQ